MWNRNRDKFETQAPTKGRSLTLAGRPPGGGMLARWIFPLAFATQALRSTPAFAAGDLDKISGFSDSVMGFLQGPLGLGVLGIGLAIAAYGMAMGSRDGMQQARNVIIAGILLFAGPRIVKFVAAAMGAQV